jgi:elongation factor 1-alpha
MRMDGTSGDSENERRVVNIVTIGHMDHGKSTLIGRMLYDSGAIKPDRLKDAEETSRKLGKDKIEFAFIMDAFQEEREDGMTIDIMHTPFESKKRQYMFIDCPGHHEFVKNMISGTSQADAALLIVSAKPGEGIQNQTKEHTWLVKALGISKVVVAINKMDTVGYSKDVFDRVVGDTAVLLGSIGYDTSTIPFVPVSAMDGDNVYNRSLNTKWYSGDVLIDTLDNNTSPSPSLSGFPTRVVVQDVYDIEKARMIVGRVETGAVEVGESVVFMPSGVHGTLESIKIIDKDVKVASPGDSIGFTVSFGDAKDIEIKRGEVMSDSGHPASTARGFTSQIYIMQPMSIHVGDLVDLRCGTASADCRVVRIINKINPRLGNIEDDNVDSITNGDAATIEFLATKPIVIERQSEIPPLGRIVIQKDGIASACGIVIDLKASE